jgi:hypothetical protein
MLQCDPLAMVTLRATIALIAALLPSACGGDVRQSSPGSQTEIDEPGRDAGGSADAGSGGSDSASPPDAAPDPCAPENRPICATLRERVVRTDSGECALYVPHAPGDPRPFDPNVLAIQVRTPEGARKLTQVSDARGCSAESAAGVLAWYFVADAPRLLFCPVACDVIQAQADDVIEILMSCASACPPP